MKILLIHNFYQYTGGEDIYFLSLVNLLKKKNHQVYAFTRNSKNITDNFADKLNVAVGMLLNTQVATELTDLINEFKPDIAHFHNVYPLISPLAYHVCKKYHIPIVQTVHNYRFLCPKALLFRGGKICELCARKRFSYLSIVFGCYHQSYLASFIFSPAFLFHNLLKSFDYIDTYIFPAEFIRNYHVKTLHIPINKTVVFPNFIDNNKALKYHQTEISSYFLFAGRLSEEKGITQLLDTFSSLPQLKLIVIGDGPLRKQVEKYKKYKNIIIKNFLPREKIFTYMKNALSTIIPSLWYEVLPMVMLESFANGTPVIVPRFGTFTTTVQEGKTGIFYEQYNFDDLKEKIIYAWENRNKLKKMREYAQKEYESKYTADRHYEALMKVYENCSNWYTRSTSKIWRF